MDAIITTSSSRYMMGFKSEHARKASITVNFTWKILSKLQIYTHSVSLLPSKRSLLSISHLCFNQIPKSNCLLNWFKYSLTLPTSGELGIAGESYMNTLMGYFTWILAVQPTLDFQNLWTMLFFSLQPTWRIFQGTYTKDGASQVMLMIKNPPANVGDAGDMGSIPAPGRSPGARHGNPLQYSCLENLTDKGAWQAIINRGHKESDMNKVT